MENQMAETTQKRKRPYPKPVSLANLRPSRPRYDEPKARRELLVTPDGWRGFKALAKAHGLSLGEFAERIGRGIIPLGTPADGAKAR
jgi:hypothetical protein